MMDIEQRLANSLGAGITLHTIRVKNHRIRYAKAGQGKPLLLIHGGTLGWGWWHPNIADLAKHFTVYAIDLPGGGRSSAIDFAHLDFEKDLVETVEEFVKKLSLTDCSIVGASIGGWLAAKIALRGRISVKKLVLVDALGWSKYRRFREHLIGFYPVAQLFVRTIFRPHRGNKNMESLLRDVFVNKALELRAEFVDYFYETMERAHNLLFISRMSSRHGRNALYLSPDTLKKITHPTLIIWGEKDMLMPLKEYGPLFASFPNAHVNIFKNAGHIPSIENPKDFSEAVTQFISEENVA